MKQPRETTAQCPACGGEQRDAILCATCRDKLLTLLAAAPQLIAQLDVTASRQARTGGGRAGVGTAHERTPVQWAAVEARDKLAAEVAWIGGWHIDDIRRHPMAPDMLTGLGTAVKRAYRVIDRATPRVYLGQCLYEEGEVTCHTEVWGRPGATEVTCRGCGVTHDVAERRAWLLLRLADTLCTVREASEWMGDIGGIHVTQDRIRGYLRRRRLAYRPGTTTIRLGDLLDIVTDDAGKKGAKTA